MRIVRGTGRIDLGSFNFSNGLICWFYFFIGDEGIVGMRENMVSREFTGFFGFI